MQTGLQMNILKNTLRYKIPQLGHVLIHIEPNDISKNTD